jgi:hypothetical protein
MSQHTGIKDTFSENIPTRKFGTIIALKNCQQKEYIPPTPTAYDSWFFFDNSPDRSPYQGL